MWLFKYKLMKTRYSISKGPQAYLKQVIATYDESLSYRTASITEHVDCKKLHWTALLYTEIKMSLLKTKSSCPTLTLQPFDGFLAHSEWKIKLLNDLRWTAFLPTLVISSSSLSHSHCSSAICTISKTQQASGPLHMPFLFLEFLSQVYAWLIPSFLLTDALTRAFHGQAKQNCNPFLPHILLWFRFEIFPQSKNSQRWND